MSSQRRAVLALVSLTLIWGYTWVLAKQALAYAGPFAFGAQRSVAGALALFAALLATGRTLRLVAPWPTFWLGIFQTGGFIGLQTWALVEGGAGRTAVLIFTMPIWTLLMAWPLLGERIRGSQWLAAGCTLAGLLLIVAPWQLQASPLSKVLGVLAAVAWAVGTILVKRMSGGHRLDMLNLTAWQMVFGAILLVVAALAVPERPTLRSAHYVGILLSISLVSTALGWFLWTYILDRLPAWEASLSVLGVPVVATLSSRLQLGERADALELAGMLLIGAGLALLSFLNWRAQRRMAGSLR